MDSNKIKTALECMVNNRFMYAGQTHEIKNYIVDTDNEKCSIITNLGTYDRKFENMTTFLSYWKPVKLPIPAVENNNTNDHLTVILAQENDLSNKLISILTENIEKIKQDKEYIPQAQAVNNNINTIVNIAKMRLTIITRLRS
jgi:hypothetical protein